ncbi:MAG: FKBP-type peptidyl-prolyl cis-trans isomerase, partial [Geothrix sp.]
LGVGLHAQPIERLTAQKTAPGSVQGFLQERASYAFGLDAVARLKRLGLTLDPKAFAAALEDHATGREPKLIKEDARKLLEEVEDAACRRVAEPQRSAGRAFLDANRKKPGVRVTTSGLQIEVVKDGSGPSPRLDQVVRVHYRGTTTDGVEFDSTLDRKDPARLRVAKVIDGWSEALLSMRVGGKVRITVPWELAYGERGRGEIQPCAVLCFDLELIGIEAGPLTPFCFSAPNQGSQP